MFVRDVFTDNYCKFGNFREEFRENKPSRNGKITLSFIDTVKYCLSPEFFTSLIMSFNAIRENKILAKISESIVFK